MRPNPVFMKYFCLLLTAFAASFTLSAQKVFFKSAQTFTAEELKPFYASIAIQDDLLIFNANDYKLYAYNKNTGAPKWTQQLNWKSDIAPFFAGNTIWANGKNEVLQLDTATGKRINTLDIERFDTQPIIINNVLYGTGIYEAGCLFAYDLRTDTMRWSRFIAHGIAQTPYYLPNHVIASIEGDSWIEVDYQGKYVNAACETREEDEDPETTCYKTFLTRTHDGMEIKGRLAHKIDKSGYGMEQVFYTPEKTFILNKNRLYVFGNKLQLQLEKELEKLSPKVELTYGSTAKIIKADNQQVWLHLGNYILQYNYLKKKAMQTINLEAWLPHQLLLDGNHLWLVSGKDGLLYGLTLD